MFKKYFHPYTFLLILVDSFLLLSSIYLSYQLRIQTKNWLPLIYGFPSKEIYFQMMYIFIPVCISVFMLFDLYKIKRGAWVIFEAPKVFKGVSIALSLFIIFIFLMKKGPGYSRIIIVYFWMISVILLTSSRFFFRRLLRYLRKKGINTKNVLIIGAGAVGMKISQKLKEEFWFGYRVVGFLDNPSKKINKNFQLIGSINRLEEVLKKYQINHVFISLDWGYYSRLTSILNTLKRCSVSVMFVPDIYQYDMLLNSDISNIGGVPVISLVDSPMYGWDQFSKRTFDIIFSILFLISFSPLFILIAILIKFDSRGSIFYLQKRAGLDNKVFKIIKFRTMPVNFETKTGPIWSKIGEKRATKLGKFLRKTSLDEIPQFFNVLLGQMSVVGPRPERPYFIEQFKLVVPRYMLRHKMKSGITGWAQINGLRGNTSIEKRIEFDVYYIDNWTLLFDIKIILNTAYKVFFDKNAY